MGGNDICCNNINLISYIEGDSNAKEESKAKAFRRHLEMLKEMYPEIQTKKSGRVTCYYLEKKVSLIHEYLTISDDMSWLIEKIISVDKTLFTELESKTKMRLEKVLSSEKDIFLYQNSPFDVFENEETKQIFRSLKSAVKNNEYRDIYYHYNNVTLLKNIKCLKLIFMENNWYVAIARNVNIEGKNEDRLFFLRISFIEKIKYSAKSTYQASQLNRYVGFFKSFQNPMSLFGVEKKKARILAFPKDAKYFKPNMKKLLNSQRFIRENEDGSVEFTLEYTQPIEVLPFIKKWLPSLKILSPKELDDALREDLKNYLSFDAPS